jgi:hypothetical protein
MLRREIYGRRKGAKKGGHTKRLHRREEVTQKERSLILNFFYF